MQTQYTTTTEKKCTKCLQTYGADGFHRDKHQPDGRTTVCKKCRNAHKLEYNAANADRLKQYAKDYHENNLEKERERYYKYDSEHRDERNAANRFRVAADRTKYTALHREWRRENVVVAKVYEQVAKAK